MGLDNGNEGNGKTRNEAWKYESRLDWKVKRKNISWSARIET